MNPAIIDRYHQITHGYLTLNADELYQFSRTLYPILRSITGAGVRSTLSLIADRIPLTIHSVPSGTQVLDWEVPEEWEFDRATVTDATTGNILVDSNDNHLHVLNYSTGVHHRVTRAQLNEHLHTLPEQPDAIPYRTSYYARDWGVCARHRDTQRWGDGPFDVSINARHKPGALHYGELIIPGERATEIVVSTHICHPALANDNVSGMVLATAMAQQLSGSKPRHSWRFLFVPGTIGAISWLANNRQSLHNIVGGLVITGLGDSSAFTYKKTVPGNTWIDYLMAEVLPQAPMADIVDFDPYGYDERQYCSPAFRLPIGRLTRAVHGSFPEYHTSDDNLDFIKPERLAESLDLLSSFAGRTDSERFYTNTSPAGEPQLGKRGLYSALGASPDPNGFRTALLWLLNGCDGQQSISQIQRQAGLSDTLVEQALDALIQADLLLER